LTLRGPRARFGASAQLPPGANLRQSRHRFGPSAGTLGWVAGGSALVLIVAGVAVALRRRGVVEPAAEAEPAVPPSHDSFDDIRAERDPRLAVLAAYARMEALLGRADLGRDEAEAPHEYLARVEQRLALRAAPARPLTALFVRARFSPHTIDRSMKEQALAELVALRDDLFAGA
jgi:hypothetical protein